MSVRVRRKCIGLRLAAALGYRLGEVGEQHREPQPGGDLAGEPAVAIVRQQVAQPECRHQSRHDLGDEDHRVARKLTRGSASGRHPCTARTKDGSIEADAGLCAFL